MSDLTMRGLLQFIAHGSMPIELEGQYHPNVVNAKCEKAIRKGYMECGVSAHTGWITDKGRQFLDAGIGGDDDS